MTATVPAGAAPAPAAVRDPGPARGVALAARLLRTEIRHSPFVWVLPLLALLFLYDPFRTAAGYPFVWTIRASVVQNKLAPNFFVFAAGFSAWTGSREGRRQVGDLLGTTARPAWTRQFLALAGTLFWVLAAFLAAVAVLYVRTAMVMTWGGPPLWPVVVGVVELTAFCVVAFTAGALFPGRFTAPIVAAGLFLLALIGFKQAVGESAGVTVLSPTGTVPLSDAGVFYHVTPDVPIVQVMFMGGIVLATLGVLGLSPRTGGAGWRGALDAASGGGARLRTVAASVLAAGAAAAVAGAALAGTSTAAGWDASLSGAWVPALHDAAADRPIPYTPVCGAGADGFEVCVHPAYGTYLGQTETAFAPVIGEIAELPGAPARAVEIAGTALPAYVSGGSLGIGYVTGNPPVYRFSFDNAIPITGQDPAAVRSVFQQDLVDTFIVGPLAGQVSTGAGMRAFASLQHPAQTAVADGLLAAIGWQPPAGDWQSGPGTSAQRAAEAAAAARFAALPAATRHAWLATHLAALRAGRVSLAQIP